MEMTLYAKLRETLPGTLKFPCPRGACDQIRDPLIVSSIVPLFICILGDIRRAFAGERGINLGKQVVEQTVQRERRNVHMG